MSDNPFQKGLVSAADLPEVPVYLEGSREGSVLCCGKCISQQPKKVTPLRPTTKGCYCSIHGEMTLDEAGHKTFR